MIKFKIFKVQSLAKYWDKDPYQIKSNIVNWKSVLTLFIVLEMLSLFIGNYVINVLKNALMALTKNSLEFNISIVNMFKFSSGNSVLMIIWMILSTLVIGKLCLSVYFAFKNNNKGHKGTQRWTTQEEIKAQYTAVPLKSKEYDAPAGIPVSRIGDYIYIDDSPVNTCVLGITRSGKGETLVFPIIDIYSRSKYKPSMVLTDPKLELYLSSKKTLEKRGYDVYLINIIDPVRGSGYNPLTLIIKFYKSGDYGTAEMLCKTFSHTIFSNLKNPTKDEFFTQTATTLLCALIWAHVEDCINADKKINKKRKEECAENGTEYIPSCENERKITLYSIVNLFTVLASEPTSGDKSVLDDYFHNRPAGNKAKLFFAASGIAGDKTKGSIYATAFSKIDIFSMEKNAKMLAENSINFVDVGFGDKPVAIFVGIPDIDKSNHFLATTFISQLYFAISNEAIKRNGKCSRYVHFILDEFGNLPTFSDMDSWTTVCLGRNIRFVYFLQSYAQMESKYGKEVADIITGNCGNQIYILVDESPSAEKFSKLIGNKTEKTLTRSGKPLSTNVSYTEHFEERPLLFPSELMNFTEGESVVVRAMKRKDKKGNPITSYPIYNHGDNKAIPRYAYLLDDFPQENTLKDVETDDRSNINLSSRMVDAGEYVDEVKYGFLLDYTMEDIFYGFESQALEHSDILKQYNKELSFERDFLYLTVGEYLKVMRQIYAYHIIETKQYNSLKNEVLENAHKLYVEQNQ